jgi:hypothetical protein
LTAVIIMEYLSGVIFVLLGRFIWIYK